MTASFESFGPFALVRPLGRGGMGEVFLARTPWLRHPWVALKRLRADVARVPAFVERFRHEALIGTHLNHASLVHTLDVGIADGQPYVASEWVHGRDVGAISDQLRQRSEGGSTAVAVRLLVDTLAALGYVHQARDERGTLLELIHRDIKPGNLLLGFDGRPKLADFGLSKSFHLAASRLTRQGEVLGTPQYLAPEIIQGRPATVQADFYGLGAVIYRFLTGVPPTGATSGKDIMRRGPTTPLPLCELRPDLPTWVVSVVEQMLEPDPDRRPGQAAGFAEEVKLLAQNHQLWVERPAVGQWLTELFHHGYHAEVEELKQLESLVSDTVIHPVFSIDQPLSNEQTDLSLGPPMPSSYSLNSRLGQSPPPRTEEPDLTPLPDAPDQEHKGRINIQHQASRASTVLNFEVAPALRSQGAHAKTRASGLQRKGPWLASLTCLLLGLVAGFGLARFRTDKTGPIVSEEPPWIEPGRRQLHRWAARLDAEPRRRPRAALHLSKAALAISDEDRDEFQRNLKLLEAEFKTARR